MELQICSTMLWLSLKPLFLNIEKFAGVQYFHTLSFLTIADVHVVMETRIINTPFTLGHGNHVSGHRCWTSAKRD